MVVLGLDAAWTTHKESGIAVVVGERGHWKCVAAVSSQEALEQQAGCRGLVASAECIAGGPLTVASIDMPLALGPITSRRACDNRISQVFGARGCSVHSPTLARPGLVSARLSHELTKAGFRLAVRGTAPGKRQFFEVYPHIAVMRLLRESYRVPYKIGRAGQYWPQATPWERRQMIRRNFSRILRALKARVSGIPLRLPSKDASPTALKTFEDALDGVVCAWIGTQYLEERCEAYGDETAAIWVPS
jgi:predicted RNase H-like nuclease